MSTVFSKKTLNCLLQKICVKYKITPKFLMSTSGAYFVWLCIDKNKNHYLIKIRRHKGVSQKNEFKKEILFNKFLWAQKNNVLATPKKVYFNLNKKPEYLLYALIEGFPLNDYYFFINLAQFKKIKNIQKIIKKIKFLQHNTQNFLRLCKKNKISIPANKFKNNFNLFKKYKPHLKIILKNKAAFTIEKTLQNNKQKLNSSLVLSHGDFHPKNIIITHNNKIGFIDWSDLNLNNANFDLAFLWLAAWNIPSQQKIIEKNIPNKQLFFLNILIWLPKYCKILKDAEKATYQEHRKKIINRQEQKNLLKLIKQATKFYKNTLSKIIKNAQSF